LDVEALAPGLGYTEIVRFAWVGLFALTWAVGCVRLGYDAQRPAVDAGPDASHQDAGVTRDQDAAATDAAMRMEAGSTDAAMDAATDAATSVDSSTPDATSPSHDAALPDPIEAGPMDSGEPGDDSAVDSGAKDLCPERSDVLFCDGFEDDFSRWSYSVVDNGSVARSTTHVRTGESSLRAATGAAGGNSHARYGTEVFDHQKSGDIWARYYYYLPSSTVVTSYFSSGVVSEVEPPYVGFSLIIKPDGLDIAVGNTFYRRTGTFPRDRWTCVELHVKIDAAAGIYEAYLDGVIAVRSPETDTLPDMGYTSLDVGIHYTDPGQGPIEVFVDDVIAGTTRIGCD
jgi:hypothetical protein